MHCTLTLDQLLTYHSSFTYQFFAFTGKTSSRTGDKETALEEVRVTSALSFLAARAFLAEPGLLGSSEGSYLVRKCVRLSVCYHVFEHRVNKKAILVSISAFKSYAVKSK